MAVTIPSDLVMDVLRQADPAKLQKSAARLTGTNQFVSVKSSDFSRLMGGRDAGDISGAPDMPGVATRVATATASGLLPDKPSVSSSTGVPTDPYKEFERLFYRNVFELVLPPVESGAFGGDSAGGIWRSMAADQFSGAVVAGHDGAISALVQGRGLAEGVEMQAEWPYFQTTPITGFTG